MTSKNKSLTDQASTSKPKSVSKKNSAKPVKKAIEKKATVKQAKINSEKPTTPQLVRDSFTIPESEYVGLAKIKKACLKDGFEIKKSELIRIGISLVTSLSTAKVKSAKKKLQTVKTGRPRKHKVA